MAILEEDVTRVRLASDLVEIAGEHIALRKSGRRWSGLCPFHAEKSPSFSVNGEESLFYCFGCGAKGDVITFVRDIEHLTFVEAVEHLAARAGIELRYDNSAVAHERKRRAELTGAMERAVDWYHQRLLTAPDAAPARSYLRERGYDGDLVRQFRIGWAPKGWDELSRSLRLPEAVLKDTGLGFVNSRGRTQDAFRGRVLFPIFDVSGAPVAFGGRIMPGDEGPKYKNSSETPLYNKSRTLYALNWAKADVVEKDQVVVCEGYTDVIGFFQAGVPRAVATCGTALTEEHVRQLKNFAKRVVLAYDADSAGQAAAERFYEWERKLGIDIAVAVFPPGTDPADAARKDPALLQDAVKNAQSFLSFRIDRVQRGADLRSPEGRTRFAERALAMIAEHPSEALRDQYLARIAAPSHLTEDRLRRMLASGVPPLEEGGQGGSRSRRPSGSSGGSGSGPAGPGMAAGREHERLGRTVDIREGRRGEDTLPRAEWEAIRAAVHQPEDVAALFNEIPALAAEGVEDVLFVDERTRLGFRALVTSATLHDAIATAEPDASDMLNQVAVTDPEGCDVASFIRLVDNATQRAVRELEVEARVRPDGFSTVWPTVSWLKLTVEQLRQREGEREAANALVTWLMEQPERNT